MLWVGDHSTQIVDQPAERQNQRNISKWSLNSEGWWSNQNRILYPQCITYIWYPIHITLCCKQMSINIKQSLPFHKVASVRSQDWFVTTSEECEWDRMCKKSRSRLFVKHAEPLISRTCCDLAEKHKKRKEKNYLYIYMYNMQCNDISFEVLYAKIYMYNEVQKRHDI